MERLRENRNVVRGEWLLDEAKNRVLEMHQIADDIAEKIAVGLSKYSFLKVGLSQEIAFDINESISFEGNWLIFAHTYVRTLLKVTKSSKCTIQQHKD